MAKRVDSISKQDKKTDEPAAVTPATEPTPATPAAEPVTTPATEPVVETITPSTEQKAEARETPETPEVATPQPSDKFESLFPEPNIVMSGPPTWVWWVLLVVGAAGLGFLAFDLTRSRIDDWLAVKNTPSPTATATATPTPTETPVATATPTPAPTSNSTLDKSKITIRVLNGTATVGAAATAKSKLEKAGFTVRLTGNAARTNAATTIYYQAEHQVDAQLIKDALGTGVLQESSPLANPDNVLVVIGK